MRWVHDFNSMGYPVITFCLILGSSCCASPNLNPIPVPSNPPLQPCRNCLPRSQVQCLPPTFRESRLSPSVHGCPACLSNSASTPWLAWRVPSSAKLLPIYMFGTSKWCMHACLSAIFYQNRYKCAGTWYQNVTQRWKCDHTQYIC